MLINEQFYPYMAPIYMDVGQNPPRTKTTRTKATRTKTPPDIIPPGQKPSRTKTPFYILFDYSKHSFKNVTFSDESRTNNICEAWNNSFRSLVGCSHPSIWRTIDNLRKDQNDVRAAILLDARGQPLKKRVHRTTAQLQQRLHNLCTDIRDGRKSLEVTLKGIGHCIRWK